MSIQKKSLISALKTSKKAKIASAPVTEVESGKSQKNLIRLTKVSAGVKFARAARATRVNLARLD